MAGVLAPILIAASHGVRYLCVPQTILVIRPSTTRRSNQAVRHVRARPREAPKHMRVAGILRQELDWRKVPSPPSFCFCVSRLSFALCFEHIHIQVWGVYSAITNSTSGENQLGFLRAWADGALHPVDVTSGWWT